jgi:hypothetical protein
MSNAEDHGQAAGAFPQVAGGEVVPSHNAGAAQSADGAGRPPGGVTEKPAPSAPPDRRAAGRRSRRRWLAVGVVIALIAVGAGGAAAAGAFGTHVPAASSSTQYKTQTWVVARRSLTSQTQVDATLGDAGSYSVVVPQSGSSSSSSPSPGSGAQTFTSLPATGQTISQGQVIYAVSGNPVVLLYGAVPAYRTLSEGMSGTDVDQLNHDLVDLGYANSADIAELGWDYYSWDTSYGLTLLQTSLGISNPSGTLTLGTAVFLPGRALITALGSSVVLGGPGNSGTVVATASSITPVVTIDLDASLQSEVKDGDPVTIALPDGITTPGVISEISTVASSNSSDNSNNSSSSDSSNNSDNSDDSTITVLASLDDPSAAGSLNSAPVTVTITNGEVSNALTVPVDALLAQPGGGYAVEAAAGRGHHLVAVTPGLFDDAAGLVQVTGNLAPGQRVVIPAS